MYKRQGYNRAIHNIENAPFRTKFDKDVNEMRGNLGIGCISDFEPQPLMVRSHHGTYAITTVGKINNTDAIIKDLFAKGHSHFLEMSGGDINATELVAAIVNQKDNPVSYTHLDVYKRQMQHILRKSTVRESNLFRWDSMRLRRCWATVRHRLS